MNVGKCYKAVWAVGRLEKHNVHKYSPFPIYSVLSALGMFYYTVLFWLCPVRKEVPEEGGCPFMCHLLILFYIFQYLLDNFLFYCWSRPILLKYLLDLFWSQAPKSFTVHCTVNDVKTLFDLIKVEFIVGLDSGLDGVMCSSRVFVDI